MRNTCADARRQTEGENKWWLNVTHAQRIYRAPIPWTAQRYWRRLRDPYLTLDLRSIMAQ